MPLNMDASALGIQVFFTLLLPGFLSGVGFRLTSGIGGKSGDFAALCWAAFVGVLLFSFLGSNPEMAQRIVANPIQGGVSLAMAGFVVGFILGIPVGWIRHKLY